MQEGDPVRDDEFVLRRIPSNPQFYDSTQPLLPVTPEAFRPHPNDADGLSVFRKQFCSAVELAARARNPGLCYVSELLASKVRGLGLSLVPDPQPDQPPGHTLIPELNRRAYEANKRAMKEVQVELARMASSGIVFEPE